MPIWIKIFIWIFIFFAILALIVFILDLFGVNFQISLYGLETNQPMSFLGIFIIVLFLFKGVVAYGLWEGKSWGVSMGILDSILGMLVCIFVMLIYPSLNSQVVFSFRLELALLIPYLVKLQNIKDAWKIAK